MNKLMTIIISILLLFSIGSFAGCSSSGGSDYADQDYIKSMAKGLEARWDLNDKYEDQEDTKDTMEEYIQAELDQLTQYESASFEDTKLQEKALAYINCLKDSKEHLEWYFSDENYDKWDEIYNERAVLIKDFVENYGLTVSSKHQATLDEFLMAGKEASEASEQEDAINKIVQKLEFEVTEDDGYGWKTYQAVFDNTTDFDIENVSIDVNLLDEEGTIVETQYVYGDNISKGQKAKMEFETDVSFDRIELKVDYFEVAD